MLNLFILGYFNKMKYSLKVAGWMDMKLKKKSSRYKDENLLKEAGNRYEIHNEIYWGMEWIFYEKAGEGIWNWQWNPRDTRMKNPLNVPENRYEIPMKYTEVWEWNFHWNPQAIRMK